MATPNWPAEINNLPDRGSWSFKPKPAAIRTDFDYGPARTRRRFTRTTVDLDFTVTLSYAEFELFKMFVDYTLAGATKWFNMSVFQGGLYDNMAVRFKDQQEPYTAVEAGFDQVRVQLGLETRGNAIQASEGAIWLIGFWGETDTIEIADRLQVAVNETYPAAVDGVN